LISSLISDGLSVVVAMFSFPVRAPRRAAYGFDFYFVIGDS